jgi:hypothetical protein
MAREIGREPKIAHERGNGNLDRRCDMIAVAAAMMVRIPFVTIGGHLIGVAGRMAQSNFVHAYFLRRNAYIRTFQHMRRRRRPQ